MGERGTAEGHSVLCFHGYFRICEEMESFHLIRTFQIQEACVRKWRFRSLQESKIQIAPLCTFLFRSKLSRVVLTSIL